MVRPFPSHVTDHVQNTPLAAIGLFVSIFALVALCAKRPSTKSPKATYDDDNNNNDDTFAVKSGGNGSPMNYNKVPKSPLSMSTPKRLLSNISNLGGKKNRNDVQNVKEDQEIMVDEAKDTFGEGGLWQKNILMGEKCQPLEHSGVIYYDQTGNRISEIPRSPRASSVISQHGTFSFPVSSRSSTDTI